MLFIFIQNCNFCDVAGSLPGPSAAAAAPGPNSDGNSAQTPIFLVISSLFIAVYVAISPNIF